ncbi:MAG: leucyl aminopeptidase family protein, partial [Myxococcota bacterium]
RAARSVDRRVGVDTLMLVAPAVPGGRLVVAPTGRLDRDYDDVRRIGEAASRGVMRARDAGATRPVVVLVGVPQQPVFQDAAAVAGLGALGGLWQPLEAREAQGHEHVEPVVSVGLLSKATDPGWAYAVEAGRRVARDLCGTEPERMTPLKMAAYVESEFAGSGVEVNVVEDRSTLEAEYPLLSAVARASFAVPRHHPTVIRMSYVPSGPVQRTLLFAGKGVAYDTGGADLKYGGHMAGMSRDKGGAAAVAGFMRTVSMLKPTGLRVVAELGCVRNNIGADSFVSDEILVSHAGTRVRIGNTDAEGRLVLADLLSHLRSTAVEAVSPQVFSVATLTGHAGRAVGPYTIAIDNGPARSAQVAVKLAEAGERWGEPVELSRLRREDFDFVMARTSADDVLSSNNAPSTGTARGHQFPMAFLSIASGLDEHGSESAQPIPYTHIDIGGSATEDGDWQHGRPTGTPVVALSGAYLT